MALFLGSTSLDIPIYESICSAAGQRGAGILTQTTTGYGRIADDLAAHLGALGPCYTFTTACTSSANALIYAAEMIQTKRFRQALVVGVEGFSQLSLYGFESLGLIARDLAKPIGGHLGGMIIGEGCGAVVLDGGSGGRPDSPFSGEPTAVTLTGSQPMKKAEPLWPRSCEPPWLPQGLSWKKLPP